MSVADLEFGQVGGVAPDVLGLAIGLLVSVGLSRVIASQLWGVSPYDPATLASVAAVLLVTGLVACWVPARRATRVDPLVALRYE